MKGYGAAISPVEERKTRCASVGLIADGVAMTIHRDVWLAVVARFGRQDPEVFVPNSPGRQVGALDRRGVLESDGHVVFGLAASTGGLALQVDLDSRADADIRGSASGLMGDVVRRGVYHGNHLHSSLG